MNINKKAIVWEMRCPLTGLITAFAALRKQSCREEVNRLCLMSEIGEEGERGWVACGERERKKIKRAEEKWRNGLKLCNVSVTCRLYKDA